MSPTDAESRLRYVQDVRTRTRHATVIPVLVVGMLGALIIARGVLMRYWPHVAGIPAAWFFSATAALLVADRWQTHRLRMQRGVLPPRLRPALLVMTIAAELLAHAIGANVIIAGVAVPLALAAWRTDMRTIAVTIAVIGAISEALALLGTRQWSALVIFGTGLVAVAVIQRQAWRRRA